MFRAYYRFESDPDFLNVGSDEFVRKFVQHDMPVVANIAAAMMNLSTLEMAVEELNVELDGVREEEKAHLEKEAEDRKYNRMSQGKKQILKIFYVLR